MTALRLYPSLDLVIGSLARVAGLLWEKGWAERNAGNISVRIPRAIPGHGRRRFRALARRFPALAGQALLVTATGSRMRDLAARPQRYMGLIRIDPAGGRYEVVWSGSPEPAFEPTSELVSHLAIHDLFLRRGRSNRVVLHTHPDEIIALTHTPAGRRERTLNLVLRRMHPEIGLLVPRGVGLVAYCRPGSWALGLATVRALYKHDIAVWSRHGCCATGDDPVAAFDLVDLVNKAARIYLLTRQSRTGLNFP